MQQEKKYAYIDVISSQSSIYLGFCAEGEKEHTCNNDLHVKSAAQPEGSCCLRQSGIHCSLPSKLGRRTYSPDCKRVISKDRQPIPT